MVSIHTFQSTGDAYDASQCREDIKNGDVLRVPSEGVVGILVDAWPVALTQARGEFHQFAVGTDPMAVDGGKFANSILLAYVEIARLGLVSWRQA